MKKIILAMIAALMLVVLVACEKWPGKTPTATPYPTSTPTNTPSPTEAPTMKDISAVDIVKELGIGWNLGNSFDASGNGLAAETAWGNPKTTKELVKAIKDGGFNFIRIPITWSKHYAPAPEYIIDERWMKRVKEVVDYAVAEDMYILINTHHEQETWMSLKADDYEKTSGQFKAMWTQIATVFKDYDEKLMFEAFNEPRTVGASYEWNGGNKGEREIINKLAKDFYDVVRATGGNNLIRNLVIQTYGGSTATTAMADWKSPNPNDKHIIASVHAYTPYNFALNINGTDHFSSSEANSTRDIDYLQRTVKQYFVDKGIPVILGECGSINKENLEDRVDHISYFVKSMKAIGVPCVWWDNGNVTGGGERFGIINRNTCEWVFPELRDAMVNAIK